MTTAERMRRHRAAKQRLAAMNPSEQEIAKRYLQPIRIFAKMMLRVSPRYYYYLENFKRHQLIKWDDDVVSGKYGRVGMEFLAGVCEYGHASAQRAVHNRIKKAGAAAGRALWQKLIHDNEQWDLIHKHNRRYNARMMNKDLW